MAKARFDTSTIEGYDSMTAEEKVSALENFEFDNFSDEVERLKSSVSKANSEAAGYKRRLSEVSKGKDAELTEKDELLKALTDKVTKLENEQKANELKMRFVGVGCNTKIAEESANAIIGGDIDAFFKSQEEFIKEHDRQKELEMLKKTPRPGNAPTKKYTSKDDILAIEDSAERRQAIAANIELFN